MRQNGEWRVHQHDRRTDVRVEMIVDLGGIKAGDRHTGEQLAQQSGPCFGQFVQCERCARNLGKNCQKASPCRGFQHTVAGPQERRCDSDKAEWDRCRELLKALHFFRAPRVGRKQGSDLTEHWQGGGR